MLKVRPRGRRGLPESGELWEIDPDETPTQPLPPLGELLGESGASDADEDERETRDNEAERDA